MSHNCQPTVQRVAQALYRDPLADRIEPGRCRVCGMNLAQSFASATTAFGTLQFPNAACEEAKELYDEASEIAELMRKEASRWKSNKIKMNSTAAQDEQERKRRAAQHALGISEDLEKSTGKVIDTGEF